MHYQSVNPSFLEKLGPVDDPPKEEFQRLEPRLIQNVLAEKAKQNALLVIHEANENEEKELEVHIDHK